MWCLVATVFFWGFVWIYESARGIKECYTSAWQKWMNLLHFCVGVVFQNILVSVIAATQAFWNPKQIFLQSLFHLDDSVNHCLHKKQFKATTKDAIPSNKMLGFSDCRITNASVTSSCKKTWRFWRLICWEENLLSRGVFLKPCWTLERCCCYGASDMFFFGHAGIIAVEANLLICARVETPRISM